MANEEHLRILKQGVEVWNRWRKENPEIRPNLAGAKLTDLNGANLSGAYLRGADLRGAYLIEADLSRAKLTGKADLGEAHLSGANLAEADLTEANLMNADLSGANLCGAHLIEADLTKAVLNGAKLMREANLRRAILRETDLTTANLTKADLIEAKLTKTILHGAKLTEAKLIGATITGADLSRADLSVTDLRGAQFFETNVEGVRLIGSRVYGISTWRLEGVPEDQSNLIITGDDEPVVTVDNLEVAQFIYLLLQSDKIRRVIDTITSKAVLILGRFTPERKVVLDAIRKELRRRDYLPIMFDFEKPAHRNIGETVSILAHMSKFIIADITDAKSIPAELERIVFKLPSVPVQPLILSSEEEYGMFDSIKCCKQVLETYRYDNQEMLLANLKERVIDPAEAKARELIPPAANR